MARHSDSSFSRASLASLLAFGAAAALTLLLGFWRGNFDRLRGDEGTYVAMTASLARDADLSFGAADEAWARLQPERPAALILQRTGRLVSYSKPILYPLLAAPFLRVLGEGGLLLFNALAVALSLALAAAALRKRQGGGSATATVVLFAGASVVLPYLAWRMTEALQVALATAGLALALGGDLGSDDAATNPPRSRVARLLAWPGARYLGAFLLGLLISLREPNAIVALVPALAAASARRWRRAAGLVASSAAALLLVSVVAWALTGTARPYKAPRATFDGETGYPTYGATSPATDRFEHPETLATSTLGWLPDLAVSETAYAAIYFVVGRHSGLLAYFPAALALLWAAGRGTDSSGRWALFGFLASAVFYLVWWPQNYFGGAACIGNRYLLAAYPCLLYVPRRLPSPRALGAAWLLAAVVGTSAALSVERTAELDPSSQNHAHAGLFLWLPYESVASNIDGRRDRYWSGDFVRFVDPFAVVDRGSFWLDSGSPPAELEVATSWPGAPLQFLVRSEASLAVLVISDWRGSRRFPLAATTGGPAVGLARFEPGPAWRRHSFWFGQRAVYRARLLRFALQTPDGRPARAELRYLGRSGPPTTGFEREVLSADLPLVAPGGGLTTIPLALRHRGGWDWDPNAPLPVAFGVRFEGLDGGARSETRVPLPRRVEPGERLEANVAIRWPAEPGRYRVEIDLLLEGVCWFGERVGAPVASGVVTVQPATATPPAPSHR